MKQIVKTGRVSVTDRSGIIYLVWNDNGQRFKESTGYAVNGGRLPDSVKRRVKEINDGISAARGKVALKKMGVHVPEPSRADLERVPMDEALERTLKLSATVNEASIKNARQSALYFQRFMKSRYPETGMPFWDEITREHLIEYIKAKQADGKKNKTIRNYITPLVSTSRLFADIDPDKYRAFSVNVRKYLPLANKEISCLTVDQALRLIPICEKSKSAFAEPMVYLGSFSGLNVAEIQSLQKKDWNSKAGVLTVRRAKTSYRPRRIPVVGLVRMWCDNTFGALSEPDSYLVTTGSGNPIAEHDYKTVTRAFRRRVLEVATKTKGGECFNLSPSDCCRETFINAMVTAGIDGDIRRAFVGHAGTDAHTRHYADIGAVEVLREQVTNTLEKHFPALAATSKKPASNKTRGTKVVP